MNDSIEVEPKPELDDIAPSCWPPVVHIVRKKNYPVKEGDLALCGAKLMGLNIGRLSNIRGKVCEKCLEVVNRNPK